MSPSSTTPTFESFDGPRVTVHGHESSSERVILVADDEDAVRLIISGLLRASGFDVVTACDGYEAVELVRGLKGNVDVVFLDLAMPNLDGVGAYHEIQALRPDIPIIFMSGFSETEIRRRLRDIPDPVFLQKPFKRTDLDAVLSNTLMV